MFQFVFNIMKNIIKTLKNEMTSIKPNDAYERFVKCDINMRHMIMTLRFNDAFLRRLVFESYFARILVLVDRLNFVRILFVFRSYFVRISFVHRSYVARILFVLKTQFV